MKKIILVLSVLLSVFLVNSIDVKIEKEGAISITNNVETDYMFLGKKLDFNGSRKNLYFMGEALDFNGATNSSLIAFGSDLNIEGKVGNDIFSVGDKIDIKSKVNGNIFSASDTLNITKESVVNGSLFVAGGKVFIDGTINGDVYSATGRVTIRGVVNGNVKVASGMINIEKTAKINGDFVYHSKYKISENEASLISGKIDFKENNYKFDKEKFSKGFFAFKIVLKVFSMICLIIGGLLLLLIPFRKKLNINSEKEFFTNLVWGLIPFFIYPVVVVILFALVITIPLAFLLLLFGLPILFITQVIGVTMFGQMMFKVFKWKDSNVFVYFLFGSLFYLVLSIIPFIGHLSIIFFSSSGWGKIIFLAGNKTEL